METQIKIFNNPQFGDIRTAGTADNPLFCLKEIGILPQIERTA